MVLDPVEVLHPQIPAASAFAVRAFGDPSLPGFSCAKLATQEVILSGTSTICIMFV